MNETKAADLGDPMLVKLLLDHKAEVDARTDLNRTPLHFAAAKGKFQVVFILLQYRANVNVFESKSRSTPLHKFHSTFPTSL